ncbi:MAG TPA: hypothetical protein VEP90_25830 [Methylomirabilota bacterium]|nr:hypothetical protein [Methylomirabilota bacterium]
MNRRKNFSEKEKVQSGELKKRSRIRRQPMTSEHYIEVEISRQNIEDLVAVFLQTTRKILSSQDVYFELPMEDVVKFKAKVVDRPKLITI